MKNSKLDGMHSQRTTRRRKVQDTSEMLSSDSSSEIPNAQSSASHTVIIRKLTKRPEIAPVQITRTITERRILNHIPRPTEKSSKNDTIPKVMQDAINNSIHADHLATREEYA